MVHWDSVFGLIWQMQSPILRLSYLEGNLENRRSFPLEMRAGF